MTPTAEMTIPANFIARSLSVPNTEPAESAKMGIVTASSEVFDAFVRESPPINSS